MKNYKCLELGLQQIDYHWILRKLNTLFSIKTSIKDNIPFKLPDLHISNKSIERISLVKFLGVMLDENIVLNDHIHAVQKGLLKYRPLIQSKKVTW